MDIELFWNGPGARADIGFAGGDVACDHDIKTAVLLSLFTDRRAEGDDALPDPAASRRGWWGDALDGVGAGRRIGSRLWLLGREKQLPEIVARAREYAQEALQWLVDDGVASRVTVDAQIVAPGVLGLAVTVIRERRAPQKFRFEFAWTDANQVRS
ncbi:Mu-like prophage protein gp46 [Noviherbaspirillum humi]|uniref:Mu-like prophage protein gp46 n=1 Tax=Noviherbaspirillum humi TaxID=1688639 RepID=A0A239LEK8_9BURK|nr:phage GP46 family protein [Noviherbaspirillum humi]SNT29076.1 Mu-like prophage protein gp46 [Noviherbaspirillum humi]